MKRQVIIVLFFIFAGISCNSSNEYGELFNQFIIDQTKLDFRKYPGVQKFAEISSFDTTLIFQKKEFLFSGMFDPTIRYITSLDENGLIKEYGNSKLFGNKLFYLYNKRGLIENINGSFPYPVEMIFEYEPNSSIKSFYSVNGEKNLFKYSDDYKTISCFSFEFADRGDGKSIKSGELQRTYSIEKKENQQYVIHVLDPKSAIETEKYFYKELKLMKEESNDGKLTEYEYDKYNNIKTIHKKFENKPVENYRFEYAYDNKFNWTERNIFLDSLKILHTERTITYQEQ